MIHRRLSALLPHHPRQFGFAPSRSTSDVVTLVIDEITRGLNEFSTVEYEHPGGGAPTRHPRHHRSLVVLIDFSTAVDTIDHGKLSGMLDGLPRLGPRTKRWLHNYLRGRYVRVCTREQHSRKQLTSAGVLQGGVPGPQLFLHCVDDLLRRMGSIYSASALMHADDLTLVASGAGNHAFAAAMQPALPLITT
ncbi:putative Reverse transcriptase (RNA-dependent DNA polymerase)/RNase H [Trypanosoma cruzi]|uniref:Putative Reverse transcriptase (RNA-dependent DNA polymerase)/RNase H n=1 Tax=Trypanosoma cruzi TaxID=5693 RepID=A0A2V2XH92_TRYCR|nr:putative Reverse transcriptase (RNA-dependent DNA polymerase)/RNase H [Trypanosoma cruzi]